MLHVYSPIVENCTYNHVDDSIIGDNTYNIRLAIIDTIDYYIDIATEHLCVRTCIAYEALFDYWCHHVSYIVDLK